MTSKSFLQKAALIFISVLLSLFAAELILRAAMPARDKYWVWQPNLHYVFHPDSAVFDGINGPSEFSINPDGFRGKEFKDSEKNYLCLGGSTTECLYLDNSETWFHQLGQLQPESNFGSIGKSGCTTREHYIQLKYYAPQLGKLNGIVMMVGLNDMMKRLSQDSLFDNNFQLTQSIEDSLVSAILLSNRHEKKWWRKTALFQLFKKVTHKQQSEVNWKLQDDRGEIFKTWRTYRTQAVTIIDSLPDLSYALAEYERNLQLIYSETKRQGSNLILINQSALYKDSLTAYENNLLWMGGVGDFQKSTGHAYYSVKALSQALSLYNQRLAAFCAQKKDVKLIDIATALPRDTSVFYDDCHFNESGARKVALLISEQL